MDATIDVLLLTQDDCKFCDEARALLERLATEFPLQVSTLDLASPEGQELAINGGLLFPPGIVIRGRPFSYGRASEGRLRREFERLSAAATA